MVTLQWEGLTWQLQEQQRCNRVWFSLIVGINVGIYLCLTHMVGMLSYQQTYVPKHWNVTNVTDAHRHETVMDRSDLRIIADWFAWLYVRPWMN